MWYTEALNCPILKEKLGKQLNYCCKKMKSLLWLPFTVYWLVKSLRKRRWMCWETKVWILFAMGTFCSGLPWWPSMWRICLQCRRPGFSPWVGKIPWRRERLPTPVFWPGEFHRLYSPWGCKESDMTEWLSLSPSAVGLPWWLSR